MGLVQHRKSYYAGATQNLAYSSNVTAGSLLVCCISGYNMTSRAVSDSLNGAWTELYFVAGTPDSGLSLWMWYKANSAGGACTVTVKARDSGTAYVSYNINEFNTILTTNPTDGYNNHPVTANVNVDSNAVDPTQTGDLLIAHMTSLAGTTVTIAKDADYEEIDEYEDGSSYMHMNVQYRIYAAETADTANWTLGSAYANIGGIAAFKASGGGGGETLNVAIDPSNYGGSGWKQGVKLWG